ncbi:MAG TPA: hypothetical protein VGH28_30620 [Polyangiaceae bacterium]|jgi:alkylhydroperoxidase family enzyme
MNTFTRVRASTHDDPIVRVVFSEIARELGFGLVPNVFHAMTPMPEVLDAHWCMVRATLLRGRIRRAVKEMIGLVVSIVNATGYSRALCLQSLTRSGVDLDTIASVACGRLYAPGLSASDTAILDYARVVAERQGKLRPADRARAEARGLSREEMLEAAAVVQLFESIDRFAETAGVPPDLW